MSSERWSSPVRTASPERLPSICEPGRLDADDGPCGTSSSPSIASMTAPLAPVSHWLRSAMTRITVAESRPGGGDRLLDLDHGLEQLGIEPHGLFGQLALGDVELGAEKPICRPRWSRSGSQLLELHRTCPAPRHHPVFLVAERAALGQAVPLLDQGAPVVGVDVLEELLVAEVLDRIAREPLEGGVGEDQLEPHVVGDDAFAHGGGDRLHVSPRVRRRPLRPPPVAGMQQEPPEQDQAEQRQSAQQAYDRCRREVSEKLGGRRGHGTTFGARAGTAPESAVRTAGIYCPPDAPRQGCRTVRTAPDQPGRTEASGAPSAWRTLSSNRSREKGFSRNSVPGSSIR